MTHGSRILAFLLGHGVDYVAGTRIGDVVRVTTEVTGRDIVAPALRLSGETTATATAAVAGAGAAILTTALICGGVYVGNRVYERLPAWPQRGSIQRIEPLRSFLQTIGWEEAQRRNFLQIEEPVQFDLHLQDGELQVVLPNKFTESQTKQLEPHTL